MSNEHIARIIDSYKDRPDGIPQFSRLVQLSEIKANDYNLDPTQYVSLSESEVPVDLSATHKQLLESGRQIEESTENLNEFISDLVIPSLQIPT